MKTVLMGTIVDRSRFPHKPLRDVIESLGVSEVFVFKVSEKNQFLLTYNLDKELIDTKLLELKGQHPNTLRLHRKKETNTFFTINAIVDIEKKGVIDWNNCKDSLLLKNKEKKEAERLSIALSKIVRIRRKKT